MLKHNKIVDKKQISKIKEKVKEVIIKDEQNWSDLKDLEKGHNSLKSTMKSTKFASTKTQDENVNYANTMKTNTF